MSLYFVAYIVISILLIVAVIGFAISLWRKYAKVVTPEEAVKVLGIDLPLNSGSEEPPKNPPAPTDPPKPQAKDDPGKSDGGFRNWLRRNGTYLVYAFYVLLYFILVAIGAILSRDWYLWWLVAIIADACHIAGSIKAIGKRENGVLTLFELILYPMGGGKHLTSGPHYIPWPLKVTQITKNQIIYNFGTALDDETRKKVQSSLESESWYIDEEPLRINWGKIMTEEDKKLFENEAYGGNLTTDPHLYVIIEIFDPVEYIEVVGETIEEGLERVRTVCQRVMQDFAGKTFVAKAITETDKINEQLLTSVENLVGDPNAVARGTSIRKSWGVDIKEVGIKGLGTPKRTNEAIADRTAAIARADGAAIALNRTSEAEAANTVRMGNASAQARERGAAASLVEKTKEAEGQEILLTKKGLGEAAALAARAKVAGTKGGRMVIQTEALAKAIADGNVTILPADMSGLTSVLTAVAASKEVLSGGAKKATKEKEE